MTSASHKLETLEDRRLLSSVVLHNRHLILFGDAGSPNDISVGFDATLKRVVVNLNGVQSSFKTSSVNRVIMVGGSADDTLQIDQTFSRFTIRARFFPGEGNNTVIGGQEKDFVICGGSGDDTIYTGNGDDTVIGGSGNDTIVAGKAFKLIFGSKGNNTITTDNGRGYIFGGMGTNNIHTGGDNFEVFGGPGNDTLLGGGFDTLWGGGGHDQLSGGTQRNYNQFGGIVKLRRILFPDLPTTIDG